MSVGFVLYGFTSSTDTLDNKSNTTDMGLHLAQKL
jgi:hypothetical protein